MSLKAGRHRERPVSELENLLRRIGDAYLRQRIIAISKGKDGAYRLNGDRLVWENGDLPINEINECILQEMFGTGTKTGEETEENADIYVARVAALCIREIGVSTVQKVGIILRARQEWKKMHATLK